MIEQFLVAKDFMDTEIWKMLHSTNLGLGSGFILIFKGSGTS